MVDVWTGASGRMGPKKGKKGRRDDDSDDDRPTPQAQPQVRHTSRGAWRVGGGIFRRGTAGPSLSCEPRSRNFMIIESSAMSVKYPRSPDLNEARSFETLRQTSKGHGPRGGSARASEASFPSCLAAAAGGPGSGFKAGGAEGQTRGPQGPAAGGRRRGGRRRRQRLGVRGRLLGEDHAQAGQGRGGWAA
jgi:hypothetical protein